MPAELAALMTTAADGLAEFRTDDEQQITSGRFCDYRSHAYSLAASLNRLLVMLTDVAEGKR